MEKLPVYIINLPSAKDRRKNTTRQFQDVDVSIEVITACNGRDPDFPFNKYKNLISADIGLDTQFSPTTFACYLSHARCWKTLLESNNSYALIVEDDIALVPEALRRMNIGEFNEEFDFVYVNSRTHRWTNRSLVMKYANRMKFESSGHQLSYLHRRARNFYYRLLQRIIPAEQVFKRGPYVRVSGVLLHRIQQGYFAYEIPAPGGDGYILSRKGAKKLLSIMQSRKINDKAVDYTMQFHSLTSEHMDTLRYLSPGKRPELLSQFLEQERGCKPIELQSYILGDGPIVYQGPSSSQSSIAGVKACPFSVFFNETSIKSN